MGYVFKFGRVKTAQGMVKSPILQFDSLASAAEHFGPENALAIFNRGLKGALSRTIRDGAASGLDAAALQAAQTAFVPTAKVRVSKGTGKRSKSPARVAREAIKAGAISEAELQAFLASRGVTG